MEAWIQSFLVSLTIWLDSFLIFHRLYILILISLFWKLNVADPTKAKVLDWRKRFNIIEGIVRGLLYLHRDSRLKIIHRDLKASNILLDRDLNPKISDFGTARIFYGNEAQAKTTKVVGT